MIVVGRKIIDNDCFPDGTMLIKLEDGDIRQNNSKENEIGIFWRYENDLELVRLIYITKYVKSLGLEPWLHMPYIPNARQDRIKNKNDVFTLKYFAEVINWLGFKEVWVLDPHSHVSEALINNIRVHYANDFIEQTLWRISETEGREFAEDIIMFYPDEGAMKRYSGMIKKPYLFGIKNRDWETGEIKNLDVAGDVEAIKGKPILIVDDICSYGGTFYHSAKKLKELGAGKIYLYVSHCENSIFEGKLLTSGLIERVFTTDSIVRKENSDFLTVFEA